MQVSNRLAAATARAPQRFLVRGCLAGSLVLGVLAGPGQAQSAPGEGGAAPAAAAAATAAEQPAAEQPAAEQSAAAKLVFERDVAPILKTHCFKCHGSEVRKGGLDLRRRFALVAGGDSGAAIVPGHPERSLLIEMIQDQLMPPEDAPRLPAGHLQTLRAWIAQGAAIAGEREPELEEAGDRQITASDREFWAFQPPARPAVPQVADSRRVRTPIDAFLLAKLEPQDLTFAEDADREVLLRRLTFDLHGLPPTPQQRAEFLADRRPDAYERLVDRLLDSPAYGERWARHWLDLAGYADSDGYLAADRLRPEAWRYRDYVIRSLNDDKPFDRFVLEQLAGDELADWRRAEELTAELRDNLVATGFLRTASDPTYANYKEPLECHKVLADTIQIFSSTFLGLTVQCARCHSHKMEPISQRDYYRLNAIFLAAYDPQRWQVSADRVVPLATDAEAAAAAARNQAVDARVAQLGQELQQVTEQYRQRMLREKLAGLPAEIEKPLRAALALESAKRSAEQKKLVAAHAPMLDLSADGLAKHFPDLATERAKLTAAITAERALKRELVRLRGLRDMQLPIPQAHLLVRGDHQKPGAAVEPGIPEVLAGVTPRFEATPGYETSGRRLALARWLVDPAHPLTARVLVNRLWARHFGRGIVATLANFGRSGSPPSHPELLDFLATELVAQGWSRKALHRLMLKSTAYRQSSQVSSRAREVDPENLLLSHWQPRRHEGEVLRDSMLQVAGTLDKTMYGPPVAVRVHSDGVVTATDAPEGKRRSLYLIVRRSQPLTLLNLFDTPRMEVNCPQRNQSIVVTQALTLLNSEFTDQVAQDVVARVAAAAESASARADFAIELLYGRSASSQERTWLLEFLDQSAAVWEREAAGGAAPDTGAATAAGGAAPATAPAAGAGGKSPTELAPARRTAWIHAIQALLNANEFAYVH